MSSQVEQGTVAFGVTSRRPEPGGVLLSTCHRPDQRTRSNLTANSTRHLPDWPAQNVIKMPTAFCGCFWLTDQFFDLTGIRSCHPKQARRRHQLATESSQIKGLSDSLSRSCGDGFWNMPSTSKRRGSPVTARGLCSAPRSARRKNSRRLR